MPARRIDLRSDTFTVPDAGMRRAMAEAEVGDDVWGEDPTVRRLEERVAALLGKQTAVYVPSGTMGNLCAVACQTHPGDEIVVDAESHLVVYEVAGSAVVAGVQLRTVDAPGGVIAAPVIEQAVRQPNIHHPASQLLVLENTHNRRGGAALTADEMNAAAITAHDLGLRVHCDGARLLNAAVATGAQPADLVASCDTVSVCLSKGLGAPVGSVLAGDAGAIDAARRWRKRLGGGMRQAGIVAAAGLYVLEHNVDRLAEDHLNASRLADRLRGIRGARLLLPRRPTNIVLLEVDAPAQSVADRAAVEGVLLTPMGSHLLRCMTYLGIDRAQVEDAGTVLARVLETLSSPAAVD